MNNNQRNEATKNLADMALNHDGGGASAAAQLLLSLQYGSAFHLERLVLLDENHRQNALTVLANVLPCDFSPADWLNEMGLNGDEIFAKIKARWGR